MSLLQPVKGLMLAFVLLAMAAPVGAATISQDLTVSVVDKDDPASSHNRTYDLYEPQGGYAGLSWPVVVVLHGSGQQNNVCRNGSGTRWDWEELVNGDVDVFPIGGPDGVNDGGFILICPQAEQMTVGTTMKTKFRHHAQDPTFAADPLVSWVDDERFLLDLIAKYTSAPEHGDPNRVYVYGYSNGGVMAHTMAARYGDVLTAGVATASTAGSYKNEYLASPYSLGTASRMNLTNCGTSGCQLMSDTFIMYPVYPEDFSNVVDVPMLVINSLADDSVDYYSGERDWMCDDLAPNPDYWCDDTAFVNLNRKYALGGGDPSRAYWTDKNDCAFSSSVVYDGGDGTGDFGDYIYEKYASGANCDAEVRLITVTGWSHIQYHKANGGGGLLDTRQEAYYFLEEVGGFGGI